MQVKIPLMQLRMLIAYVGDTGNTISDRNSKINSFNMPFPKF